MEYVTKILSKDDVLDLIEDPDLKIIGNNPAKYGKVVFKDNEDYYEFSVEYNDGIKIYGNVTAYLVRPKEKTITV